VCDGSESRADDRCDAADQTETDVDEERAVPSGPSGAETVPHDVQVSIRVPAVGKPPRPSRCPFVTTPTRRVRMLPDCDL
jgi:hypothetical protein